MGRAFEFRKERKLKRWGHMARTFTKLGKEITIAVKQGGPDVTGNPRLRALMAEARSEQMPKENIERAIKKATESKQGDFKEIIYEGFGPFGIAYLVEAATDNNTRTVANVRSYKAAVSTADNIFAPAYLLKEASAYEALGQKAEALACYKTIENDYPSSLETYDIAKHISRVAE